MQINQTEMITQLYVCSANIFYIERIYPRVFDLEREVKKDHKKFVKHCLENSDKYKKSVNGFESLFCPDNYIKFNTGEHKISFIQQTIWSLWSKLRHYYY